MFRWEQHKFISQTSEIAVRKNNYAISKIEKPGKGDDSYTSSASVNNSKVLTLERDSRI
jgi:hypothetical protein